MMIIMVVNDNVITTVTKMMMTTVMMMVTMMMTAMMVLVMMKMMVMMMMIIMPMMMVMMMTTMMATLAVFILEDVLDVRLNLGLLRVTSINMGCTYLWGDKQNKRFFFQTRDWALIVHPFILHPEHRNGRVH